MKLISMKSTSLWFNLMFITAIFCNMAASVYKSAHFYEKSSVSPQILSNIR